MIPSDVANELEAGHRVTSTAGGTHLVSPSRLRSFAGFIYNFLTCHAYFQHASCLRCLETGRMPFLAYELEPIWSRLAGVCIGMYDRHHVRGHTHLDSLVPYAYESNA